MNFSLPLSHTQQQPNRIIDMRLQQRIIGPDGRIP